MDQFIETLDDKLMHGFTKAAKAYQDFTGNPKSELVRKLYGFTAFEEGTLAALLFAEKKYLMAFALSGASFMDGVHYISRKMSLIPTEKIPDAEADDKILLRTLFFVSGLIGTCVSVPLIINSAINEKDSLLKYIASSGFSFGYVLSSSARYIEAADLEPPSGKSVLARIKDYLHDTFSLKQRLPQPGPAYTLENYLN